MKLQPLPIMAVVLNLSIYFMISSCKIFTFCDKLREAKQKMQTVSSLRNTDRKSSGIYYCYFHHTLFTAHF